MNRIIECFSQCQQKQRKVLIPYIAVGDPKLSWTLPLMQELVRVGADVIELGVPFSDPMVDGPVIQQAHQRALEQKVTLSHCLATVSEFRQTNDKTPVILMGYLNPIAQMGYPQFALAAAKAGVDGVLIVDVPLEESSGIKPILVDHGIAMVDLLAPTTPLERRSKIAEQNNGFLYYVSFQGITGASQLNPQAVNQQIKTIKACTTKPVVVGFGVKDGASAVAVSGEADGVVVGSALVQAIQQVAEQAPDFAPDQESLQNACALMADIRQALDGAI